MMERNSWISALLRQSQSSPLFRSLFPGFRCWDCIWLDTERTNPAGGSCRCRSSAQWRKPQAPACSNLTRE